MSSTVCGRVFRTVQAAREHATWAAHRATFAIDEPVDYQNRSSNA